MPFIADDLGAWLTGLFADRGRRRLTTVILGTEQERALRSAATAAVRSTVEELQPGDDGQARQLEMVISTVFSDPVPSVPQSGQATLLEALQAGIAGQLAVLDDASLTGTGQSTGELLGIPTSVLAEKLTGHLLQEILVRGASGGPLFPLASQLNADVSHLQARRLEGRVDRLEAGQTAASVAVVQLPPLIAGFTDRDDEIAMMLTLLDPANTAGSPVVSAVAGLAGVGKTALVMAVGHAAWQRSWFRGGVLFIDLHGYDNQRVEPEEALDTLLRALKVPTAEIPLSAEARAALYRSVLAKIPEPVLVIADNASSESQVQPLIPGPGPHKIVVTSRHTLALLGARLVEVTVLDEAAAVALLDAALRAARPEDDRITRDREAASRLVTLCGMLPLALQLAAVQLKSHPALSVGELADELAGERQPQEQPPSVDGQNTAVSSVEAAFELSYAQLESSSARMFRLLSLVDGDISTQAAAFLADVPVANARKILYDLATAHLVSAVPGGVGRWRMHDLVRQYAKRLSDAEADADGREEANNRLLRYLDTTGDHQFPWEPGRYAPEPVGHDFYTTTDSVGYAAYANAIARAIQHKETKPPLAIGIKGSWGAGKTSLMRMVQDRLEWPQSTHPDSQGGKRRQIHLTPRARELTYQGRESSQAESDGVRNGTVLRALTAEPDPQDDRPQAIKAKPNPLPAEAAEDPEVVGWRPTVWFNPWMYQTGEEVWAGLAYEIIRQITDRMSTAEREHFWLKLNLKRVDEQAVRRKIYGIVIERLVPYAAAALIFVVVGLALLATDISRWFTAGLAGGAPLAFGLIGIVQIRSVLTARVSGNMSQLVHPAVAAKNLTSESTGGIYKDVVESPDYKGRAGFFYLVRTDVQRVLDLVATEERPVVVFVDDLDRCSPGTVVQVIEAINLFLAGEYSNAIFVAAMEPEMVAAHIEAAYEDLARAVETAGISEVHAANLGWKFLEKIVQLPLTLPALEPDRTMSYFASLFRGAVVAPDVVKATASELDVEKELGKLADVSLTKAVQMSQSPSSAAVTDAEAQALRRAIDRQLAMDDDEIKEIIDQVIPWLSANPRELKRFVNVFRFLVVIDSERGLRGMPSTGDLNAIAKLAVLHIRWPDLIAVLSKPRRVLDEQTIYEFLEDQSPLEVDEGEAAMEGIKEALQRCRLARRISDRIAAMELQTFVRSDPRIGVVARNYL